jgi:hypothetical protein
VFARAVVEDVAKVGVARRTTDFDPDHAMGSVFNSNDVGLLSFRVKGRPTATAWEFTARREQDVSTTNAAIHARA